MSVDTKRMCARRTGPPALARPLSLGFLLLCAACPPSGALNTPERLGCLRACDKEKEICLIEAQAISELNQCDGKDLVCVGRCPR